MVGVRGFEPPAPASRIQSSLYQPLIINKLRMPIPRKRDTNGLKWTHCDWSLSRFGHGGYLIEQGIGMDDKPVLDKLMEEFDLN